MLSHFHGRGVCVSVSCDVRRPFFPHYCNYLKTISKWLFQFSTIMYPCLCPSVLVHICLSLWYLLTSLSSLTLSHLVHIILRQAGQQPLWVATVQLAQDQGQQHACPWSGRRGFSVLKFIQQCDLWVWPFSPVRLHLQFCKPVFYFGPRFSMSVLDLCPVLCPICPSGIASPRGHFTFGCLLECFCNDRGLSWLFFKSTVSFLTKVVISWLK